MQENLNRDEKSEAKEKQFIISIISDNRFRINYYSEYHREQLRVYFSKRDLFFL